MYVYIYIYMHIYIYIYTHTYVGTTEKRPWEEVPTEMIRKTGAYFATGCLIPPNKFDIHRQLLQRTPLIQDFLRGWVLGK